MEGTFAAVDTVVTSLAGAPEPDGHRSILDPRCIKPSIILLMPRSGTVLYSTLYYTFDQALYYTQVTLYYTFDAQVCIIHNPLLYS